MSKRAILAATAILVGSFNPILAFPAWAAVTLVDQIPGPSGPSGETLDAMQAVCDTKAAAHDTGNGDIWTGEVVQGAVTLVSGPTEVAPLHSIDDAIVGTLVGVGFIPGSVTIDGDPFRIGGSVNMFGIRVSHGGSFSSSTYDFTNDFETTYSYAFSCDIKDAVYHPAHTIPGTPPEGFYTNPNENGLGDCQGLSPNNPHWGQDIGACIWTQTAPGTDPEDVPESWDDPVFVVNEAADPINETQTDNLRAHEDAGEGYTIDDDVLLGQAVICISPSKTGPKGVPGTWTKQNGYTGDKCTTAWFNVAPWGAGSQTSKGTYISVPGV